MKLARGLVAKYNRRIPTPEADVNSKARQVRTLLAGSMVAVLTWTASAAAQAPGATAAPDPTAAADARRIAGAMSAVAAKVSPSVVQIDVAVRDDNSGVIRWYKGVPSFEASVKRGLGSGVILSSDGHILTNNHVIDDALAINVRLQDGRMLPATLVGRDPGADLALIKIQATGLQAAQFADSDAARVGEWVLAIGSPFGLGHTVTMGVLSAKSRGGLGANAVEDYLQTDASINPGNSGGPLVNLDGQVIGINDMIVGRGQGIGFAIPSKMARRVADQLLRNGRVKRAWIGVGMQDLTPEIAAELRLDPGSGVLINHVASGGPAERARLQIGDIIATIGGKPARDSHELMREVLAHDVGASVRLEVIRGGKRYATDVGLAERPESPPPPLPMQQSSPAAPGLGMTIQNVYAGTPQRPEQPPPTAAQIVAITPGSPADRAGLRPGDIVLQIDGATRPDAAQVLKATEDGHALLLVQRRQGTFYAAVRR
ncbi:MAG TPA: trypsin-like peptidase domain-containing protein [Polyangiaceae bacterium]|nr:trypsin-like peptidase domain-containing protein [Polyangiaceae bacterium]